MALDDQDRADIADMIAEASKANKPPPPASRRQASLASSGGERIGQSDWDGMSERDRQSWVRREVEDHLATLDAEAERENLRAENEELRRRMAEWEKGGRQGKRPTKSDQDKPRSEEAPTLVGKAYKFLFGEAASPK